jgi:arginase
MAEAATLDLPYPETAVVAEDTLGEQTLALAADLPERPLVLGGCCCAHVGALEGLAARHDQIALVWLDAHGDLNTPESSPSGNPWGMPLRMVLDAGTVAPERVALVGARNLDPPEAEFIVESGLQAGEGAVERALGGADCVYVALDCDSLEPSAVSSFMPEPGGLALDEVERLFTRLRESSTILGAGLTGLTPAPENVAPLTRLCSALGL